MKALITITHPKIGDAFYSLPLASALADDGYEVHYAITKDMPAIKQMIGVFKAAKFVKSVEVEDFYPHESRCKMSARVHCWNRYNIPVPSWRNMFVDKPVSKLGSYRVFNVGFWDWPRTWVGQHYANLYGIYVDPNFKLDIVPEDLSVDPYDTFCTEMLDFKTGDDSKVKRLDIQSDYLINLYLSLGAKTIFAHHSSFAALLYLCNIPFTLVMHTPHLSPEWSLDRYFPDRSRYKLLRFEEAHKQ